MSSEERAASISGKYALGVAFISVALGFLGGKSGDLETMKYHTAELSRQQIFLTKQFEEKKKKLLLVSWQSRITQLHNLKQSVFKNNPINYKNLNGLSSYVNNTLSIERQFKAAEFTRFLRDNASKKQLEKFHEITNERSVALFELQKISGKALLSKHNASNIDKQRRSSDLLKAVSKDMLTNSSLAGFINSATIKSLLK